MSSRLSIQQPIGAREKPMRDRVANSVLWLVWSRGGIQAISFVTTLVVARFLSPADYGLMALAAVFTSILGTVSSVGLEAAVVQFQDLDDDELNFCFFLGNAMAWLTYAALYAASPLIATWFNSPDLSAILRAAGLIMPITAVQSVHASLLVRQLRFDCLSKADIAAALFTIPILVAMAWRGYGVWALVTASLCKPFIGMLVIFWYERWIPGLTYNLRRVRSILSFSVASFGSHLLWATYDQADSFILGKMSGELVLGFYTMARDLASVAVVKISTIVNQLSVPVMAQLQDNPAAMRTALLRGIRLVSGVSFPLCTGLLLVAEDAVRVALGEKWLPIVPIVQLLCIAALIKSVDVLLPPVLRARFRAGFIAGYNTVLLFLMPPLFVLGAVLGGAIGVAAVWITGYPIVMLWMAREALREIDLGWGMLLGQLKMPFVAVLGMTVVVMGIQQLLPGTSTEVVLIRFATEILAGALTYGAILLFWGGQLTVELRQMLRWIFRPGKEA